MGQDSGYIALQAALAGGCEDVIIPERAFDLAKACHEIVEKYPGKNRLDYS